MKVKYLSLFAGIGAFELALSYTFGKAAQCVGFSEIDKNALKVYQSHFPDHTALGDVKDVDASKI